MIIDVTGTVLVPGNCGEICPGRIICCDECDFLRCCIEEFEQKMWDVCMEHDCPHCRN